MSNEQSLRALKPPASSIFYEMRLNTAIEQGERAKLAQLKEKSLANISAGSELKFDPQNT